MSRVTKRDYEILRTLVRVHLARASAIQTVFFPEISLTRRRMRRLRDMGLVEHHTKGLPQRHGALRYWRISDHGLRIMRERFPDETIPDGLVQRCKRLSLYFWEHQDELVNLYLSLIRSKSESIDEVTQRADAIQWLGDRCVSLSHKVMGGKTEAVVPDATITTESARIFIEIDRSTESHTRCKKTIAGYRSAIRFGSYKKLFPDNKPVVVLYSTLSQQRARNLAMLMRFATQDTYTGKALEKREATEYVRARCNGVDEHESDKSTEFAQCVSRLRELYEVLRIRILNAGGTSTKEESKALRSAYEFLQAQLAAKAA